MALERIEDLEAEVAKFEEKSARERVKELEARVAELEAAQHGPTETEDEGSARALALYDRLLAKFKPEGK